MLSCVAILAGAFAQEYIFSAFSSTSFNPIRSIPDELKAATVNAARKQRVS